MHMLTKMVQCNLMLTTPSFANASKLSCTPNKYSIAIEMQTKYILHSIYILTMSTFITMRASEIVELASRKQKIPKKKKTCHK